MLETPDSAANNIAKVRAGFEDGTRSFLPENKVKSKVSLLFEKPNANFYRSRIHFSPDLWIRYIYVEGNDINLISFCIT